MRWLRVLALSLALSLLLLPRVGAADSITGATATMYGARFLVLGDSYTAGYGLESPELDWTYLMADTYGMTQLNYSISGSSFAAGDNGRYPMVERCLELPEDEDLDFILLQGGSNDWSKSIPLGEEDSRDATTFCGALNLILNTLREKYPDTPIVGFTPWISDGSLNQAGASAQDYTAAMLSIFARRGILCYDASDTERNGMYLDSEEFRAEYCLRATDWYHLNAQGHAIFAPIFAAWLEENLLPGGPADRYYDLAAARTELRDAVSLLDGVVDGTSGHLFSPTRALTREVLVLALYRLAGEPDGESRALSDVDMDTETYAAVCWAMEAGIFSPADSFSPNQSVTRQMLATVLYRYDTAYLGNIPGQLTGIGSYPDVDRVADYARLPLSWALSCGALTDADGLLKPQSLVSRGDACLALAAWLAR